MPQLVPGFLLFFFLGFPTDFGVVSYSWTPDMAHMDRNLIVLTKRCYSLLLISYQTHLHRRPMVGRKFLFWEVDAELRRCVLVHEIICHAID
jgi:hypothetical protein